MKLHGLPVRGRGVCWVDSGRGALLGLVLLAVAFGCSNGTGDPSSAQTVSASQNQQVGFTPGMTLTSPIQYGAVTGGVIPDGAGGPDRSVIFFAFETSAAADDGDGTGTPLARSAPGDSNGALDVFLAAIPADRIDPTAFSQALAGRFRHPRCITCHSMRTADSLAFLTAPAHKGPAPGTSFPAGTSVCMECHEVSGWQAPDATFDFRGETSDQLSSRARRIPVDSLAHFRDDPRVTWALSNGRTPLGKVADDNHNGIKEPEDTDGVIRTVPGGRRVFLRDIEDFLIGGALDAALAVTDIVLVSQVDAGGNAGDAASSGPSLVYVPDASPSGNKVGTVYVAFASAASDLVPGDNNGTSDVFRVAIDVRIDEDPAGVAEPGGLNLTFVPMQTVRASVQDSTGTEAVGGDSLHASIDGAMGNRIAFESRATNLVSGFTDLNGGEPDAFLHDLATGSTWLVSRSVNQPGVGSTDGGNGGSYLPKVSSDGEAVVFESDASDLVASDQNGQRDVHYLLVAQDLVFRASVATGGGEAVGGDSRCGSISVRDAATNDVLVAFESAATNLPGSPGLTVPTHVYLHESLGSTTHLISQVRQNGLSTPGNRASKKPVISADGRTLAFETNASNLDVIRPIDNNRSPDVILTDLSALGTTGNILGYRASVSAEGADGNEASFEPAFGSFPAGSGFPVGFLLYETLATNLGASDDSAHLLAFVKERPLATPLNQSPTCLIRPPEPAVPGMPAVGAPIIFDATSSRDVDGAIRTFDWDFGDGTASVRGRRVSHTYASSTMFTVTLSVVDNQEATSSCTTSVTVRANQVPLCDAGMPAPQTVRKFEPVMYDASASMDPDGTIVSYEWDFGDGTTGAGQAISHNYVIQGTFTATLTVTDDLGASSTCDATSVTVNGEPATFTELYAVFTLVSHGCLACHNDVFPSGFLSLGDDFNIPNQSTAYANLVGVSSACIPGLGDPPPDPFRVVAGNSATSFLVSKVLAQSLSDVCGSPMPPGLPQTPLDGGELAILTSWINAGALDN